MTVSRWWPGVVNKVVDNGLAATNEAIYGTYDERRAARASTCYTVTARSLLGLRVR